VGQIKRKVEDLWSLEDYLALLKPQRVNPVDTVPGYSNYGWSIAGLAVEVGFFCRSSLLSLFVCSRLSGLDFLTLHTACERNALLEICPGKRFETAQYDVDIRLLL
jgi:hypothetical protein